MQVYLDGVCEVAKALPDTKFLMYTKKNSIRFPDWTPDNLVIRFSYWPNWNNQTNLEHGAWIFGDPRIPRNGFLCPKDCRKCSFCWNSRGKNVIFEKH